MKRATRDLLVQAKTHSRSVYGGTADDILDSDARQRAEIRDLKARLEQQTAEAAEWAEVVRLRMGAYEISAQAKDALRRIYVTADLKRKNWRKP